MRKIIIAFLLAWGLAGIAAVWAAGGYAPANCGSPEQPAVCCLKPWIVPDRWIERSVPPDDVFDADVDIYDTTTGYRWPDDLGTLVTFIQNSGGGVTAQLDRYYAVRFGPVNRGGPNWHGAKYHFRAIVGCEVYAVAFGDTLQIEPGGMVGPTTRGLDSLISLDPSAYYDPACKCIRESQPPFPYYLWSPRIVHVATFRPSDGLLDKGLVVVDKVLQVFVESRDDQGNFRGRIMGMVIPCPPGVALNDCLKPWPDTPQVVSAGRPGDVTDDGQVDLSDLSALIRYLTSDSSPTSAFDLTGDGVVDVKDVAVMVREVVGE